MTVQTTNNKSSHVGNGVTTVFAYDYLLLDAAHMQVFLDDVLQSSGYVVDPGDIGNPAGGNVTITPAPGNGVAVTLVRIVPHTQLVDYIEFDPFPSETHEQALDLAAMGRQQLDEERTRTLIYPVSETPTNPERILPPLELRKNNFLAWDANGLPLAAQPLGVPASSWGAAWVQLSDSLAARNTLDTRQMKYFDGIPGVNQDSTAGYAPLDQLVDQNTNILYSCADATPGAAVWVLFPWGGSGGGGGGGAYVGEVRNFGAGDVPLISEGWLPQDGRVLDSVANPEYAALYAKIGTKYGGTGPDNFSVGDARGRSTMGSGTGVGLTARTEGEQVGTETHQLTEAELPSHNHSFSGESNRTGDGSGTGTFWRGTATRSTNNTGSDQPHPNVHPVLVGNFGICYDPALSPQLRRFTDLIDTPATYAGAAKKPVTVTDGESGLTFGLRDAQTIDSTTVASLTLNVNSVATGALIGDAATNGGGLVIAGGDGSVPNGRPLWLRGWGDDGAGRSVDIDGDQGLALRSSSADVVVEASGDFKVTAPATMADTLTVAPGTGVAQLTLLSTNAASNLRLVPGTGTVDQRAFDFDVGVGTLTLRAVTDAGAVVGSVFAADHAGNADFAGELREQGQRVYSPNNPPPAGGNTFIGLTDTPGSYAGQSGRFVAVLGTEDGTEFVDPPTGSGDVTITGNTNNDEIMLGAAAAKGIKNSGSFLSDFATAGHGHPDATTGSSGFMSAAQVTALNETLRQNTDNAVQKAAAQGQLNFDLLSPDASVDLRIRPGLGTADQRAFDLLSNGTALQLRAVNDAFSVIARTLLDMTWASGDVNVASGILREGTIPVVYPTDRVIASSTVTLDYVGSPVVILTSATAITLNAPTSGEGPIDVIIRNDVGCTLAGFTRERGTLPSGTHKVGQARRLADGSTMFVWGTD